MTPNLVERKPSVGDLPSAVLPARPALADDRERVHPVTLGMTRLGWTVLALTAMLASTVLWHARPWGLVLAVAFLIALAWAWWSSRTVLRGLRAEWLPPEAPRAGEEIAMGARLSAGAGSPPFILLAWQPASRRTEPVVSLAGMGLRPVRHRWGARFPRRGLVTLPALEAEVAMPFGLVSARGPISLPATTIVLPATGIVRRELRDRLARWLDSRAMVESAGDEEFAHLRDYRPGDPPRRIHWPASARHHRLLVSERHEPTCRRLALVVDTAVPKEFARFEQLISIAATLVEHLLARGWTVGLHGSWLGVEGVAGDRQRLLTALALARIESRPVSECLPAGRTCVVLAVKPLDVTGLKPEPLVLTLADCAHLVRLRRGSGE